MGKAARRRKARRRGYLAELSYEALARFGWESDKRLQSWLSEIRLLAGRWAKGEDESERRFFELVDYVISIFEGCERSTHQKYLSENRSVITHECCAQVSRVIDPRLYRLSNMEQFALRAKRSARA